MQSLYNEGERVDIGRSPSDALLLINSADRSSSTSATGQVLTTPTTQPYNNFRLQKPQNMVQGGFTRLKLTEVNFPYAIPNINPNNCVFWVVLYQTTGTKKAQIIYPPSPAFVDGKELATYITAALNGSAVGTAAGGATWSVIYLPNNAVPGGNQGGGFNFTTTATATNLDFALYPIDPAKIATGSNPRTKSLLDVMGFSPLSNWGYLTNNNGTTNNTIPNLVLAKVSSYAPMSYTSYIDIVSKKLTYYQRVADGTTNVNGQSEVICRLYIADETSTAPALQFVYDGTAVRIYYPGVPAGSVPFNIHRQFPCPKSFRWDPNTAIDWFDISLYDDYGNLLYIPDGGLPDFQITMKCSED
jgi:hypothetical protein